MDDVTEEPMVRVCIHVPPAVLHALDTKASKEKRPRAFVVREALAKYLKRQRSTK